MTPPVSMVVAQYRQQLQAALEHEAQRAVDAALADAGVDVAATVVVQLVGERALTTPARRRTPPAARAPRTSGTRGRPPGRLRAAILGALADGAEYSTDDVRAALAESRVKTSTDNLHQQLRRLVQAGLIERVGRGTYRTTNPPAAPRATLIGPQPLLPLQDGGHVNGSAVPA